MFSAKDVIEKGEAMELVDLNNFGNNSFILNGEGY